MNHSDVGGRGPLRFRRGPSCFWIITAPLFLGCCLIFYGAGIYFIVTETFGWLSLLFLVPGSFYVYKWGKAFRFWSATFDNRYEAVFTRRGVFFPVLVREYHFANIEALHLGRKLVHAFRGKSFLVYPVSLSLADGAFASLLEYTDFFQARRMAEEAAVYAKLPLIDASVDPPQFIAADKVGKPLRAAEPSVRAKPLLTPAPRSSRCRIVWEDETAVIRLPICGLGFVLGESLKGAALLALITGGVSGVVWWATANAETTTSAVRGTVLYFCLPLLSFFMLFGVFFKIRTTTIRIDHEGLRYRERALLARFTRRISHAELKSIRQDGDALEILTARERIRFGAALTAPEREWLCESLNKLAG